MIKKILGSIFIIGLGFLGFSNASFSLGIVGQDATSVENQNYDISILSNYEFKTTFGGVNKRLFAPKETEVWWWGITGNMHYSNVYFSTKYNGIVKYFYLCDYIETLTNFSNCTKYLYSSNLEVVKNILNNVSAGDTFFYGQAGSYMEFNAVSVQSLNQTIVFPVIAIQRSSAPNDNTSISAIGISFNGNDCNNIQSGWWVCNLDNYDNSIGYDFSTLPNNLIGVSPGFPAGGGDGGQIGDQNINIVSKSCTKQKALLRYENNGYTKKLCYGGYDDFTIWDGSSTGVLPYYGSGLNIEEIWLETANYYQGGLTGTAQSYSAWFGYRRQLYSTYKRGGYSANPFVNTPLVMFGLFGAVDTYGVNYNSNSILEYCDLKLFTSDYNVAYTGVNKSNVCSLIDLVVDQVTDGSGNVIIGVDTNNIVGGSGNNCLGSGCNQNGSGDDQNGSGDNKNYDNGSNFILDFSEELKSNFGNILNNNYGLGILPIYITIALCGLLLFRFMAH